MPRKRRSRSSTCDQEPQRKWRRVIIYSDSESEKSDSDHEQPLEDTPNESQNKNLNDLDDGIVSLPQADSPPLSGPPIEIPAPEPEIDAELLAALGDPADDIPAYGENIQQGLAQRWQSILRKGIPKESKETLLKEFTVPENCKLLRAPTLNAEISAATSEALRKRDKYLETKQNQLGLGITAVGRGLSQLLTSDDKQGKVQAVKSLSDGCKILCDLHNTDTQSRIKILTPSLDKAFLHVIEGLERDETLFSCKLSDKIKAAKTIEKQGLQIKKTPAPQKTPSTTRSGSTSGFRTQGNWTSSSRYQSSNKGGARGGAYNKYTARSRKPQAAPLSVNKPTASTSKPRAQTR